jgi:excisionase family DNA binding protein
MTLRQLDKMFNPQPNPYELLVEDIACRVAEKLNKAESRPEAWMSVAEAAKHFGVGQTTIREAVATGELPHTHIGNRLVILVSEVRDRALKALK